MSIKDEVGKRGTGPGQKDPWAKQKKEEKEAGEIEKETEYRRKTCCEKKKRETATGKPLEKTCAGEKWECDQLPGIYEKKDSHRERRRVLYDWGRTREATLTEVWGWGGKGLISDG